MSCNVYIIKGKEYYKIGLANDVKKRMSQLQISCPFNLSIFAIISLKTRNVATTLEKDLHERMSKKGIRGEWFNLDKEDLTNIKGFIKNNYENASLEIFRDNQSECQQNDRVFIDINEAADKLDVSTKTIRRRISQLPTHLYEAIDRSTHKIKIDKRLVDNNFKNIDNKDIEDHDQKLIASDILEKQLIAKDEQIMRLNEHINKLIELMGQNNKIVINALS